ncbi:hypothetical protein Trydic_g18773 [Trypoxylus dichotomus]
MDTNHACIGFSASEIRAVTSRSIAGISWACSSCKGTEGDPAGARVTPVFKGGERSTLDNYRPISILSVIDKVMERYIADKLLDYLNKYRVIDNKQYGFQRGKETVNLLEDFADIINAKLHEASGLVAGLVAAIVFPLYYGYAYPCLFLLQLEESLCCLKLNAVAAGVRRLTWGGVASRPSTVCDFTVAVAACRSVAGGSEMIPDWLRLEAFCGVLAWLERIVIREEVGKRKKVHSSVSKYRVTVLIPVSTSS